MPEAILEWHDFHSHDSIGIAIRKGIEQNRVDHAEHGRRRADSQRQRDRGYSSCAAVLRKIRHPKRKSSNMVSSRAWIYSDRRKLRMSWRSEAESALNAAITALDSEPVLE